MGAHMLYDQLRVLYDQLWVLYEHLWEIVKHADWRLMTGEYEALAAGALVVAAVLIWKRIRIWKRMRRIETQLLRMEKKIAVLELQESGRLMRLMKELNAKSRAKVDPRDTVVDGGNVVGLTISPPTSPAQAESAKSAKLPG
jgi:hypothetical protein